MNKYTYLGLAGLVTTSFFTMPAMATVMMDGSLQTLFNSITSGPVISASKDQKSPSGLWSIASSGGSENAVVFTDSSSSGNAFGIYNPYDPSDRLQIFSANATAGTGASLTVRNDNTYSVNNGPSTTFSNANGLFGYYVTNSSGQTFFSYPRNGGVAQMVAYEGNSSTMLTLPGSGNPAAPFISGEYLLGFDSSGTGNTSTSNYTSGGVYEVESVVPHPMPEPSILMIFSAGLLMMGLVPRVRRS